MASEPLVLASRSQVRRGVLAAAGVALEIAPADIDERTIAARAGLSDPAQIAALLAREKARAVAARFPGRLVLGADQTLALGQRVLSKPGDRAAAREQLRLLRGQTHALYAALALAHGGHGGGQASRIVFEHFGVARLTMRMFSDRFVDAYLAAAGDAVTASVGAYQVEKLGIHLFQRIEGDHFTILGLPLIPLLEVLRREGCVAA